MSGGADSDGTVVAMETPQGMVGMAGDVYEERKAKAVKDATGALGWR